jgi:hypothetical protein
MSNLRDVVNLLRKIGDIILIISSAIFAVLLTILVVINCILGSSY